MAETVSPRRPRRPDDYNMLATEQSHPIPAPDFQHFQYNDLHHIVDRDRIYFIGLSTVSIMFIVITFFPFLQTQLLLDQELQHHQFTLKSLTISEFHAESNRLTGKCEATFNISNPSEKSVYHENSILSFYLDYELLWVVRTGDFFVDIGDSVLFNVSTNRTSVSVPDFVPSAVLESWTLRKPLRFKLKYDGMVREGLAAWEEKRDHEYIVCGRVEMRFLNETTLKGGPANCSIVN